MGPTSAIPGVTLTDVAIQLPKIQWFPNVYENVSHKFIILLLCVVYFLINTCNLKVVIYVCSHE